MVVSINLLFLTVHAVFLQLLVLSNNPAQAFQPSTRTRSSTRLLQQLHVLPQSTHCRHRHRHHHLCQHQQPSTLFAAIDKNSHDDDNDINNNNNSSPSPSQPHQHHGQSRRRYRFAPRQFLRRCRRTLTIASIATVTATFFGNKQQQQQHWTIGIQAAHASAPVMAMPKAEGRDPGSEALLEQERRMTAAAQKELLDISTRARQIEATQGKAARQKFEKQVQEQKQQQAAEKAAGLVELKRNLLRQGIDPYTDIEGKRQVILYEKGIDLGDVPGTPFHLEKELERTAPKRSLAIQKKAHREAVACMVQDMENRGDIDPVEYFAGHQDKTMALMNLPTARVNALLQEYKTNLEQYGQITVPKLGEMSAKEKMALREQQQQQQAAKDPAAKRAAREQAKRVKAEQQAKAKAERERIKAEKKAERERARAQAKAAKEEAKHAKQAAKVAAGAADTAAAAAATAAGAAGTGAAAQAAGAGLEMGQPQQQQQAETVVEAPMQDESMKERIADESASSSAASTTAAAAPPSAVASHTVSPSTSISPVSVVTGIAVVGGGGYMFKFLSDKAARDEEERQRQFRLLMGEEDAKDDTSSSSSSSTATATLDDIDTKRAGTTTSPKDSRTASTSATSTPTQTPPEPVLEAPKKRRLGIKKMFGKKSDRVTDLNKVVGEGAKAPEFATLLAKILTFGAPGRFPAVLQLGDGDMPMETFDLETAKKLLSEQREASGLELQESAEIFADVVNCMLIDIVDLASTSLKEKDDDVTVKSINIVVDFMNHAASLYDSVAEGVIIKPVTYGGELSKGKLEQMYSTYAVSGMMGMFGGGGGGLADGESNLADDFDNRVALLQDVFQISEKKAEGLMMKAVQKNMMEMLKDGKGMEGMEEMLGGMGGMGGIPGMGEDGEGPSPEQLKEMLMQLKEMKDAGSIPAEEFDAVRKQFKEAFGSNIDDFVKDAGSESDLSETDKELLDLMKAIMED